MSPQTFKHFRILELLGKGGMGEVYLALDTTLERKVALKFLPRDLLRDPSAQGRLLDEARSISRVQHKNIAVVHSIEEDGGIFALCMEYVDGATIKQLIARGPLSLNQIVRIGADIASGMQVAHEQGIIHRDLKPANVMISRRGETKVMDFGLAVRPQRVVNTLGPNTYGTVLYMSPEQAQGKQLTPASDIFSFGSLLYEIITGRPPFNAANDLAILQSIINNQPEALRDLRRDVTPALEQIVRGCMAKMPEQRWASMHDIHDELQYVEPTVEAGPRDLISELSSGLADQSGSVHHRPDNAGRVGRRSPARGSNPTSGPIESTLDIPEEFVVHEVIDGPRDASRSVARLRTGESPSVAAPGAPQDLVLGPELPTDSSSSDALVLKSTSEQWQERARGNADALQGPRRTRSEEIALEAKRRARDSRSVRPVGASGANSNLRDSMARPAVDPDELPGRIRRPPRSKSSPMALLVPALVAILLVVVAGYGILRRAGIAPPIGDVVRPQWERLFGANADSTAAGDVDAAAVMPATVTPARPEKAVAETMDRRPAPTSTAEVEPDAPGRDAAIPDDAAPAEDAETAAEPVSTAIPDSLRP